MTQDNSITDKRTFTHLSDIERGEISAFFHADYSLRQIALKMGRDISTISREIKQEASCKSTRNVALT